MHLLPTGPMYRLVHSICLALQGRHHNCIYVSLTLQTIDSLSIPLCGVMDTLEAAEIVLNASLASYVCIGSKYR